MFSTELLQYIHLQHPLPCPFSLILPIVAARVQLHFGAGRILGLRLLVTCMAPMVTTLLWRVACPLLLVVVLPLLLPLSLVGRVEWEVYLLEEHRVYPVRTP